MRISEKDDQIKKIRFVFMNDQFLFLVIPPYEKDQKSKNSNN